MQGEESTVALSKRLLFRVPEICLCVDFVYKEKLFMVMVGWLVGWLVGLCLLLPLGA
jgi:hypothetical protein